MGIINFAKPFLIFIDDTMVCYLSSKSDFNLFLRQGLSEPEFYGDLVYKLKKIVCSNIFSEKFIKICSHYKKVLAKL